MTATGARLPLTLSIHPNVRGFGWAAFEGPLAPFDWGLVVTETDKNARCLKRIEAMLARLEPQTLILEAFESDVAKRSDRVTRLCRAIVALAADRGVEVAIYGRREIAHVFAHVGARTRHDIAEAVARHIEALRHRLPPRRRPWQAEDRRMALFSAAALALTHYQLNAQRLLDELARAHA